MELVKRNDMTIKHSSPQYWVGESKINTDLLKPNELCGYFDGVNVFFDYMDEYMPTPRRDGDSSEHGNRGGFFAFESYEEALDTYKNHPSKVKKFDEVDLALTDLEAPGQEGHFDVTGDYLDIGRYLEGDPESFGVMYDGNPRARRVNLTINIGWNGSVSAEVINACSRRIQRLVDWLEARGVRVSIKGVRSGGTAHVEVMIKDHGDTLDLNTLAVATHTDFFRRVFWRFSEYSQTWNEGYGNSMILNRHFSNLKHDNEYSAEFDIVIGNGVGNVEQVDREFDQAEQKLSNTLGNLVLEPSQRFILLFKSNNNDPMGLGSMMIQSGAVQYVQDPMGRVTVQYNYD